MTTSVELLMSICNRMDTCDRNIGSVEIIRMFSHFIAEQDNVLDDQFINGNVECHNLPGIGSTSSGTARQQATEIDTSQISSVLV